MLFPFLFALGSVLPLAHRLFIFKLKCMFYGNVVSGQSIWRMYVSVWERFDAGHRENNGDKKMLCIHLANGEQKTRECNT